MDTHREEVWLASFSDRDRALFGSLTSKAALPGSATVVDVSARDGLQTLPGPLDPAARARWATALLSAGIDEVEAASFANPARLPSMSGAAQVLDNIEKGLRDRVWVLAPNRRGFDEALTAGARNVICLASATESHSAKNLGRPIKVVLADIKSMPADASDNGVRVRVALSVAWGDEEEGETDTMRVAGIVSDLAGMGFTHLTLCDTWGAASPLKVIELIRAIAGSFPADRIGLHLHDTFGFASANTLAGLLCGVTRHEGSILGLGGCPFLPGARGNIDTVHLIKLLNALGVSTVPKAEEVARAAIYCQTLLSGRNGQ